MLNLAIIEKGHGVRRCHTEAVIKEETVGHHSAHVAAILLTMYAPRLPSPELLAAAILHDVPEGYTGDIPANVKMDNPDLAAAYTKLETQWWGANGGDPKLMLDSDEVHLLKLADMISLARRCIQEDQMGNELARSMYLNIAKYTQEYYDRIMLDSQVRTAVEDLLARMGVQI